jgi:lysozyme
MDRSRLQAQLERREGRRHSTYQDSKGLWTIGIGRNVDSRGGRGLSDAEIDLLLANDIDRVAAELAGFPWFAGLDDVRQNVLMDMNFNLGFTRFAGFKQMLAACARGDFAHAAEEMLDSKWRHDVGERAVELAAMMRTGEWP